MGQTNSKELTVPVDGMTCGGCAASVERALSKLPGVSRAAVDLAKKQANIVYDPNQVDLPEFHHAVEKAGYAIPATDVLLQVEGMNCVSCATHVGGALEDLPGVLSADVNLSKGTARVGYVPALTSIADMEAAVSRVGYRVSGASGHPSGSAAAAEEHKAAEQPAFSTARFSRFKKLLGRG